MIPSGSTLAEDIRYGLAHWQASQASSTTAVSSWTPTRLKTPSGRFASRKNALFAGHEVGAENWALLSSIVATCKLNDVNPVAYIAETLTAILDGPPAQRNRGPHAMEVPKGVKPNPIGDR
ncbi:transposase domain-containing protein [Bradyrhizobium sp. CCBAU 45394]|uniref:transposase domain-containing protein n=1 Tax=Bradyrhizobium sp. CCBAU 45394 TaxID=1325087 RepID=UPI003FA4A1AD